MKSRSLFPKNKPMLVQVINKTSPNLWFWMYHYTKSQESLSRFYLLRYKRWILRRIFIVGVNQEWRKGTNAELLHDSDLIRFIKADQLWWAGYVARMHGSQILQTLLIEHLFRSRPIRRLKLHWANVRSILYNRDWKSAAQNKNDRQLMLQEAFNPCGMDLAPKIRIMKIKNFKSGHY